MRGRPDQGARPIRSVLLAARAAAASSGSPSCQHRGRAVRRLGSNQTRAASRYSSASAKPRSKMSSRPPSAKLCQSRWVGVRPVANTVSICDLSSSSTSNSRACASNSACRSLITTSSTASQLASGLVGEQSPVAVEQGSDLLWSGQRLPAVAGEVADQCEMNPERNVRPLL
jgi:hypothetical protein